MKVGDPMIKNCIVDGTPFETTKASAKYCSARCNKRAQRGQFGQTSPVEVPFRSGKTSSAGNSTTPDPNSGTPGEKPFVRVTREELEHAGVLDTVIGQQVLLLAQSMTGKETAGGLTTLSKEFSRMRNEALRTAAADSGDTVDELRARREKKAAG